MLACIMFTKNVLGNHAAIHTCIYAGAGTGNVDHSVWCHVRRTADTCNCHALNKLKEILGPRLTVLEGGAQPVLSSQQLSVSGKRGWTLHLIAFPNRKKIVPLRALALAEKN